MDYSHQGYAHGTCNEGVIELSYKKEYKAVSIRGNGSPVLDGLELSDRIITVEQRKCKGCPGCFFIGKQQWFKEPAFKNEVFWSRESRRLKEFVEHTQSTTQIVGNDREYCERGRMLLNLQRVALRYLFEEITRARAILDPDTLSVILDECYLKPSSESWKCEAGKDLTVETGPLSKDYALVTSENIKREFEFCSYLYEVIAQCKFF